MASRAEKLIREKKMPKMEDVRILIEGTQTLLREREFNVSRQEKAKKDAVEEIRTTSWKKMIEGIICDEDPTLVGVPLDTGLAEWVRKQDVHNERAKMLQKRLLDQHKFHY